MPTAQIFTAEKIQNQPPEVFHKKSVLKNFAKFKGKHLCLSLFVNNVATLSQPSACDFSKKETLAQVNFAKFLRAPFSIEYIRGIIKCLRGSWLHLWI